MLTAHLPSGFLLGRGLKWRDTGVMGAALVGAILPDLDMFWFYLVDGGEVHHHRYWPHVPAFWLLLSMPALFFAAQMSVLKPALAFFAAIVLHLLLDSVGGGILWNWPFDDSLFTLVEVPAKHGHWILSFLLHWTFLLELAIWIGAIALFLRQRRLA